MIAEIIKQKLPYGSTKLIANKAGVSIATVYKYLEGKSVNQKVENAALEVIAEIAESKRSLLERINSAAI